MALGYLQQTQDSYMVLFRNDKGLASQLMEKIQAWVADRAGKMTEPEAEFADWVSERERMAEVTNDLSSNNTRTW